VKIKTDQPFMHDSAEIANIVAKFWDQISEGWRKIWGPHIHHGFYEVDKSLTPLEAQENLIEKLADILHLAPQTHILDVGCGMGGSSLYLAKKYHAQVLGITLSPKQVRLATLQSRLENIANVDFKVENALSMSSCDNNTFDIVWSLESCEQFYDKDLFIKQALRVLKPGGQLMLATWCSSQDEYEGYLAKKYRKLCLAFDLPYMPTMAHYRHLIEVNGFTLQSMLDWSKHVEKSWDVGVSLASTYSFLQLFKLAGLRGLRFASQIKMMQEAFHQHRVKYGVFLATKT
jgi:tocopherol O-methyltransferase